MKNTHNHLLSLPLVAAFAVSGVLLLTQHLAIQGEAITASLRTPVRRVIQIKKKIPNSVSKRKIMPVQRAMSPRRHSTGSTIRSAAPSVPTGPIKAGCGDKLVTGSETCDDGNAYAGDGCATSCRVETGFICDNSQPSECWSTCGDGAIASTEKCDDTNREPGDGCNADCKTEVGYTCTGTPSTCAPTAYCGNAIVEGSEVCDDGNSNDNDGCTVLCKTN